jgi:hypothetical protein
LEPVLDVVDTVCALTVKANATAAAVINSLFMAFTF